MLRSRIKYTNTHYAQGINCGWNRRLACLCTVLCLGFTLHAQEKCPVEIKLLLSPPSIRAVIASIGFKEKTAGQVYFFDTKALTLQKRGVILRVRQGANNDLTVKVRLPDSSGKADAFGLSERFPCEIDQTPVGANTSYTARRKYKAFKLPETGADIAKLLSKLQTKLLQRSRISIDWSQVARIANIKSTTWKATDRPSFPRLTLELWESSESNILELSTKVGPDERQAKYVELQRLTNKKGLSLNSSQGNKTSMVLERLTHDKTTLQ